MINRDELLNLFHISGYNIDIELRGGTKYITYTGCCSVEDYRSPTCYSADFSDSNIRSYEAFRLLHWAGGRVTYALTF